MVVWEDLSARSQKTVLFQSFVDLFADFLAVSRKIGLFAQPKNFTEPFVRFTSAHQLRRMPETQEKPDFSNCPVAMAARMCSAA